MAYRFAIRRSQADPFLTVTVSAGGLRQRLVYDAIPFGQAQQRRHLFVRGIGVERDDEADALEADRDVLGDAERAAEVEIAFGLEPGVAQLRCRAPSRRR